MGQITPKNERNVGNRMVVGPLFWRIHIASDQLIGTKCAEL